MAVDWSKFKPVGPAPDESSGVDWSQFTPIDGGGFSNANLPRLGGLSGFSPEFQKAVGIKGPVESFMQSLPAVAADMFGSYEDVAKAVAEKYPGARLVTDRDGFPALELPSGERFAMNLPGIQGHEIASAAGNVAAFTPAGRAAGAVRGGLLTKAAVGGGASGLTDIALQVAAGRDDIDPTRTVLTAAGGAFGEMVGPKLGEFVRKGVGAARSALGFSDPALAKSAELVRKMGVPDPAGDIAKMFATRWDEIEAGADPRKLFAESELGLKLTRGQRTGDYGLLRQEEMLRASTSRGGETLRQVDDFNRQRIEDHFGNLSSEMVGRTPAASPAEAMERIAQGVRSEFDSAQAAVRDLYSKVRDSKAFVPREAIESLPSRLKQSVSSFNIDDQLTPSASRVLQLMKSRIDDLPENVSAVTIKAIETERMRLNKAIGSAGNKADRAALTAIKREFDQWYDDLAENAVISGDDGVIQAMKSARDARATLARRFEQSGPDDAAGKLIERMIKGRATPDDLAQAALGASSVSKSSATQFMRKLRSALKPSQGPENPAWGELKSAVMTKLVTGRTGEPLAPGAIVNNLKDAMRNRPTLMRELYSPTEIAKLERAMVALEHIVPKGMMARSSGTTERAFAYIEQLIGGLPMGPGLIKAIRAPAQAKAAANAMAPLRPYGDIEAAIAGAGAAFGQAQER